MTKQTTNPKDLIGSKKPALSLVPPTAILELAMAFKDGAAKYGRSNWRTTQVRQTVYIDAALRHLLALADGEDHTRDSHVRHEAAVMACMAIIIDARAQGTLIDDRPVAGKFGGLLEEYTSHD